MIRSIFIGNLSEIARALAVCMEKERRTYEIFEDHGLCDRMFFSAGSGNVFVSPLPFDPDFAHDSIHTLGWEDITLLTPKHTGESTCQAILSDQQLVKTLTTIIEKHPGVAIRSYAATDEFIELISFLKKRNLPFTTPEMPAPSATWTQAFFDSKAGFRQAMSLLPKTFPAMPEGIACNTKDDAIHWISYFRQIKRVGCVMKTNNGLAGAGLHIFADAAPAGSTTTLVQRLFSTEAFWQKYPFVIEEYKAPTLSVCGGAPNIELVVNGHGVHPLYTCSMRMTKEGVFKGVELGRGIVPHTIDTQLTSAGKTFGKLIHQMGYRGFFELDFVASGKTLYPLEANLRRTGGTHVYEIGKALLGARFLSHAVLLSQNYAPTPGCKTLSYKDIRNTLTPFLYPIRGKKEGLILTILSLRAHGQLGYMIIAKDKKRAEAIETQALHLLS